MLAFVDRLLVKISVLHFLSLSADMDCREPIITYSMILNSAFVNLFARDAAERRGTLQSICLQPASLFEVLSLHYMPSTCTV